MDITCKRGRDRPGAGFNGSNGACSMATSIDFVKLAAELKGKSLIGFSRAEEPRSLSRLGVIKAASSKRGIKIVSSKRGIKPQPAPSRSPDGI
jgi:hypothetical protein